MSYETNTAVDAVAYLLMLFCDNMIKRRFYFVFTHADGSQGSRVSIPPSICLVSVIFPHDISKYDLTRIIKRRTEMFHNESSKPGLFGVKMLNVKITSHKNIAGVVLCTLVSAGLF